MAKKFRAKPSDKFAFGVWCVMNRGADPFGEAVRAPISGIEAIRGLGERGVYGFEFHDNDLLPMGATPAQRAKILKEVKKVMADTGIKATAATTNLFYHKVFKDGAFTSHDPKIRAYAVRKVIENIDVAAELGTEVYIFWGGREGCEVDIAKDPIESAKRFREALDFLCDYVIDSGYKMVFSLEPKPNEPRSDIYLPTAGHALAFIATLDHPDMVGVNPEWAHIKMAGLNPLHEFAQALEAKKLVDIHLNGQKPLRFDQDFSFGWDNPKEAVLVVKLLADYGYCGTKSFDSHPYRTELEPWDYVERNMKTYKLFEEKVDQINADTHLCQMLEELQEVDDEGLGSILAAYSKEAVGKLRRHTFNPEKMAARPLLYEQIDQRLTEVLLGA